MKNCWCCCSSRSDRPWRGGRRPRHRVERDHRGHRRGRQARGERCQPHHRARPCGDLRRGQRDRARHRPYRIKVAAPAGASAEAAAVAAAHRALVRLYPAQKDALAQAYAKSLGRIADGGAKTDGIAVGDKVGAEMVALRANDGATAPNSIARSRRRACTS